MWVYFANKFKHIQNIIRKTVFFFLLNILYHSQNIRLQYDMSAPYSHVASVNSPLGQNKPSQSLSVFLKFFLSTESHTCIAPSNFLKCLDIETYPFLHLFLYFYTTHVKKKCIFLMGPTFCLKKAPKPLHFFHHALWSLVCIVG